MEEKSEVNIIETDKNGTAAPHFCLETISRARSGVRLLHLTGQTREPGLLRALSFLHTASTNTRARILARSIFLTRS